MRLSKLQKYILLKCSENINFIINKKDFYKFYTDKEVKNNKISIQVVIQNSIENLIKKDLIIAFGHKTKKKWTVDKVKLTSKGKKHSKELLLSKQKKLPIE